MDNVDNPKTFWRACAFGLFGLWKSLGCAGDILGKTAFWRACARILAARRPGWTAASGRQCGASPPKGRFWPPQKAVIHIIPKSAFPQKWRKKPSSYRGFGGAPTNFPPGYPPIAPRRRAQAPSPKTAPKEAKRYTLQHYIILCQPTQIKGWWGGREGFCRAGRTMDKGIFFRQYRIMQTQTKDIKAFTFVI